jgi:predicted enzyme related to lactoylglutathione lyase
MPKPMDVIQGLDAITVHLTEPHKAKAREFYSHVLGLDEISWDDRQGRGVWLIPGGGTLVAHVMMPGEPGRPPGTVTGVMFAARDVRASAEEIRRRGGHIVDEPWTAPWGPMYVTVADPDGNEYLLIQRPPSK